jgi:hypothetical protein
MGWAGRKERGREGERGGRGKGVQQQHSSSETSRGQDTREWDFGELIGMERRDLTVLMSR